MGLKRKRSMDCSPISVSSYGTSSTPEAQSPTPVPNNYDGAMDLDITSRFNFNISLGERSHLGSRTRKRFRDNRPDERVIHENTINKLFSAQRNHPHAEPILSSSSVSPAQPQQQSQNHAPIQKSTLHSFWKLPAPPVQAPTIQIQHHQLAPSAWNAPRCDDCDVTLQDETDAMDVDMDMDMDGGAVKSQFACNDCGKNVCGTCAVVSTTRHCLQCATTGRNSRRWW